MIVFRKTLVCYVYLLFVLLPPQSALCAELVGVLPFSNQRYQKQDDWLGYYIQARIKTNLSINSDWKFHQPSVLRLWLRRVDRSLPVSPLNTILIQGTFQRVVDLGHISIRVQRNRPGKASAQNFEISFFTEKLDEQIDDLSKTVGLWIHPDFNLKSRADFPRMNLPGMKDILQLRQKMFEVGNPPDIQTILTLEKVVDDRSPHEMISDLAEAMLVLSRSLQEKEQKLLLTRTELFLRKAIMINRKQSRLYALLAETYFFNNGYASWVEKTAKDAVHFDSQDELGYILSVISNESDAEARKKDIEHIKQVNPWLFSKAINGSALFQNGILNEQLSKLVKPLK